MAIKGTWKHLLTSDRLRRSSHVVTAVGETVCIFGGELEPRKAVDNQVDIIELGKDKPQFTTKSLTPSPPPRLGTASALCNDRMYLFSGRPNPSTPSESASLWNLDPESLSWHLIDPLNTSAPHPCPRSYHAATSDGSSMIFVSSGCSNETPTSGGSKGGSKRLNDFWKFDLFGRSWVQSPDPPGPARGGASMTCRNSKVYRMNGFDGERELGGRLDIFDLDDMEWTSVTWSTDENRTEKKGPGPRSVGALLALTMNGREKLITLFGEREPSQGGHEGAGRMWGDVWVFDVEEETWSEVVVASDGGKETNGVPQPRGWFGAAVVRDGQGRESVVVHGGLSEGNERLGDVWQLTF